MSIALTVYSAGKSGKSGKSGEKLALSEAAFGRDFNQPLVHQVVTAYRAGGRAGTRAQKNRAQVRGGGAKPWRQKGTGRARAGTIRSPLFRGGGVAFPARPQNYAQKVNRNMYRAAMRSILSELRRQDRLIAVDALALEQPSTKTLLGMLTQLGALGDAANHRCLIVLADDDRNVQLSARNLPAVSVCRGARIDPLSLISHDKIVVTLDAAKKIDEALQ